MPKYSLTVKRSLRRKATQYYRPHSLRGYTYQISAHTSLKSSGECKLCTVELDGELVTACTTEGDGGNHDKEP